METVRPGADDGDKQQWGRGGGAERGKEGGGRALSHWDRSSTISRIQALFCLPFSADSDEESPSAAVPSRK